jgi:hypothetical protein
MSVLENPRSSKNTVNLPNNTQKWEDREFRPSVAVERGIESRRKRS